MQKGKYLHSASYMSIQVIYSYSFNSHYTVFEVTIKWLILIILITLTASGY